MKVMILIKYIKLYQKEKKLKMYKILIETFKDMNENADFNQNYCSRTAVVTSRIGHDSIRLVKRLAYYDRSDCENIKHYDLLALVLSRVNEIS